MRGVNPLDHAIDLVHAQRRPPVVSARALNEHQLHVRRDRVQYALFVQRAILQLHLLIADAEVLQRTGARLARNADDLFQRVIRLARGGQQGFARPKHAVQAQRQRVRAGSDLRTHQRLLRAEHLRDDLGQRVAANIVVAVAGRGREVARGDAVLLKRAQHAPGVLGFNRVQALEYGRKLLFSLANEGFVVLHAGFLDSFPVFTSLDYIFSFSIRSTFCFHLFPALISKGIIATRSSLSAISSTVKCSLSNSSSHIGKPPCV